MNPNLEAIPDFLTGQPRWILWRTTTRKGKLTKEPYTARNLLASSTRADTWSPFPTIAATIQKQPGLFDGVGFVLGELSNGDHTCGIDLDSCLDESGDVADWAQPIVMGLSRVTYGETSPSGTGLKFFFRCAADDANALKPAFGVDREEWGSKRSIGPNGKDHGPAVEVYLGPGRYFAVTGQHWPTSPEEVALVDRGALSDIAQLVEKAAGTSKANGKDRSQAGRDTSRSAIAFRLAGKLRRAGATFEEMCEGIREHPETAEWYREKGSANGGREMRNIWQHTAPRAWLEHCQANERDIPRSNLANVMVALREAPELQGMLAFDEMAQEAVLMREGPNDRAIKPRPVNDCDASRIQEWLQLAGLTSVPIATIQQAVDLRAREALFHPVKDYLDSLSKWDGTPRLPRWLNAYLGVDHTEILQRRRHDVPDRDGCPHL